MQKKITIVDDEIKIRETLKVALESEGYNIETYPSCDNLFTKFATDIPDLIILDLMMPWQKGEDFLKRLIITEQFSDIPVYIITGKLLEDSDKQELIDLGVRDIFNKPFDIEHLISKIKGLFNPDFALEI